ncbi:MAG TPA: polyketide cyclase, partial [Rhodospirillaceae bacterium]|nr:polyketide cyclase [Rhodospirillaceae bacterium]
MNPRIPLTAILPSDRELRISREFDAPRDLVFKAYT